MPKLLPNLAARPGHRDLDLGISEQILDQTDRPVSQLLRILLRCRHERHPFVGSAPPPDPGRFTRDHYIAKPAVSADLSVLLK